MKLNALKIVDFIGGLKDDIGLTKEDLTMIEENGLLRYDIAKILTNFAFDHDLKSFSELSQFQNLNKLYPKLKSIIEIYRS